MSMKDGGPAFPIDGSHYRSDYLGMAMLDYFAAHALTLFSGKPEDFHCQDVATIAYDVATFMLAERGRRNGQPSELEAVKKQRDALLEACRLAEDYPEINFSNYGEHEVQAVQDWAFTLIDACRAAIAKAEGGGA